MTDVAEFTDEWGASVRVERLPRFSSDAPYQIEILIHEAGGSPSYVHLNYQQAAALRDALTDLIG